MGFVDSNPRLAVTTLESDRHRLIVHWGDGHTSSFQTIWLRHACQCEACGTYISAIRSLRLPDIPDDIAIATADRDDEGRIQVTFSGDGHSSLFDPAWLRGRCNSTTERTRRRWTPILWGKEIEGRMPEADYATCRGDPAARLAMLETLRDYGFVLVRGVPADPEETEAVAGLAGPLRVTNYGSVYDFTYNPDALVYGDLNVKLDPHTDEPYRQAPPSLTCFHFIRAATSGGENTMTDSFRIGAELRDADPEGFRLLSTLPLTFYRRLEKQDRDFRMRAPVFSLDEDGEIAGVPDRPVRSFRWAD